jgi:hypothetical protein
MAMNFKDLTQLAKITANATPSSAVAYSFGEDKFSYTELNDTLRKELNEYACDYRTFEENKNAIFRLIEETIDDVLPKKVLETYGQFAEMRTIPQGDKAIFTQRITTAAKRRAKQFVTRVGLAGRYEVFKLDGRNYEVPTNALGGAAQIGFEEFLDGRIQMSDVLDIMLEGLDEAIYIEIERSLKAAVSQLPAANRSDQTGFDEAEMDRLIQIADAYGGPAAIYCTFEFAATMVPAQGWVAETHKIEKWSKGYLANYKGHQVIVLPQSYEDETNETKVIDPSVAYIIPSGAEKPVKIVFEGNTIVREVENEDYSREVQTYKKVGVGNIIMNNICAYVNSELTR